MGGFAASAGCAGCHVFPGVTIQIGPPKALLEQGHGTVGARMTYKTRCVSPLQHLRMDKIRNKEAVSWPVTGIWLLLLSFSDCLFNLPRELSNDAFRREDGIRNGVGVL